MPSSKSTSKSAKAVRAAGKVSPSRKGGGDRTGLAKKSKVSKRQIPWLTVGAAAVIIAFVGALAYNLVPKFQEQAELEKYTFSEDNQDPSKDIDGVVKKEYPGGFHVTGTQRVAYDATPAFGGTHDENWATCTGTVYSTPIRTENAVHSLEHGAVWIAYNPDKVDGAGLDTLKQKVEGKQFTMLSPYPGLDTAVSLQSWGHQLKLDSADDKRIGQFIMALRQNPYNNPEPRAGCSTPYFDTDNPPPFDPNPPGPDAIAVDGKGLEQDQTELNGDPSGMPPGMQTDPATGLPIDPSTGLPFDPNTGMPIDPSTGLPMQIPGLTPPPAGG